MLFLFEKTTITVCLNCQNHDFILANPNLLGTWEKTVVSAGNPAVSIWMVYCSYILQKSWQVMKKDVVWREVAEIKLCCDLSLQFGYVPMSTFPSHSPKDLWMLFVVLYWQPLDCFPCLIDEEVKRAHSIHFLSELYLLCETLHNLFSLL